MSYGSDFSHMATKTWIDYMTSFNYATQTLAAHNGDTTPDLKHAGGGKAIVAGTLVASLPAETLIDMSDPDYARADRLAISLAGRLIPDNSQFVVLVTAEEDGVGHAYLASTLEDDDAPGDRIVIPRYVPTELCIGLMYYDVDTLGTRFTVGTSIIMNANDTYVQLVGPNLLPDISQWGPE